jgi:hypothetical protein
MLAEEPVELDIVKLAGDRTPEEGR